MNIFTSIFTTKEVEVDDPNLLPPHLRDIYMKPHKILGLNPDNPNKDEEISELREIFRKMCIGLISEFTGYGKGKLTAQQLNLVYHIIRGTVKKSAKYIAENLDSDPFLADFQAEDILPLLRPCLSSFPCNRDYRGFRNFAIRYIDDEELASTAYTNDKQAVSSTTTPAAASSGSTAATNEERFVFDVHYALRRYRVTKTMTEFINFNKDVEGELLMVPELPDEDTVSSSSSSLPSRTLIGQGLAYYIMRIHQTLADRNLFSPRMLNFLGIDYERVQTEEEGAIVAVLDTPELPTGSKWHIIDEKWLLRWRTYVKGRGPRRYYPPGKITNEEIFKAWKDFQHYEEEQMKKALEEEAERKRTGRAKKKDKENGSKVSFNTNGTEEGRNRGPIRLKLSEHYRCVNYNVWRFFVRVHGGGPNICRSIQDIYSPTPVFSDPDAIVAIQCQMRGHLARKHLNYLQMKLLSSTKIGKQMLLQMAREEVVVKANQLLEQQRRERVMNMLHEATVFTQTMWRKKKKLFNDEEKLMKRREEQLIFRKAHRYMRDVAQNKTEGIIVEELQPIIHIGGTNTYQRVLHDSESGIPFKIMQKPGTEFAMISSAKDESLYFKGSVIRSINQFPTNTLTYLEVKMKLSSATFPLTLVLEKMYSQKNLPLLADLAANFTKQQLREKQQQQREYLLRTAMMTSGVGGISSSSMGGSGNISTGNTNMILSSSSSLMGRSISIDKTMLASSSIAAGESNGGNANNTLGTTYDENSHKVGLKDMSNDEKLMYNMFKLALVRGIRLIKHSTHPPLSASKSHFSILRITNQHLYYRSVNSKAIPLDEKGHRLPITSGGDEEEDHYAEWSKYSLYCIKYIREGKESKAAVAMNLPVEYCFEIELEDKGSLLFQFPDNHQLKRHLVEELSSFNAMSVHNMRGSRLPKMTIKHSSTDGMKSHHHPMYYLQTAHSHLHTMVRKRGGVMKLTLEDLKKVIDEMERLEDFVEKFIDEKSMHLKKGVKSGPETDDEQKGNKDKKGSKKEKKEKKKKGGKGKDGEESGEEKVSNVKGEEKEDEKEGERDDVAAEKKGESHPVADEKEIDGKVHTAKNQDADKIVGSPKNAGKTAAGKDDDDKKSTTSKDDQGKQKKQESEEKKAKESENVAAMNHGVVHLLWQELRYLIREDLERARIVKKAKEIQIQREKYLENVDEEQNEEEKKENGAAGAALIPEKASDFGSKDGSILSSVSSKIKEGLSKGTSILTGRYKKKPRRPETKIVLDAEGRAIRVNIVDEMKRKEEILSVVDNDRILAGHLDHDLLERKCTFAIWNLKRLVDEVRGSQIFIHKSGLPVKRKNPKVALSRINGGL